MMTTAPEVKVDPVLDLRGISAAPIRLYPVVDHIADKVCATQATYGDDGTRPSSRVRDLVVFGRTQDVDGDELIVAMRAEWAHRSLPRLPCSPRHPFGTASTRGSLSPWLHARA